MTTIRRLLLHLAALLGVVVALGGCRMDEPFDVPLLFEHEPESDRVDDTIPILFSGWETEPSRDDEKAWVLWPALRYARQGREKQFWVFGVPVYRRLVDDRGFDKVDAIVGPVMYGHSVDRGSYLTILPLGGTMRGILGKRYVASVLFPFFMYTEDDVTPEWKSVHILFPFVNFWYGGGRSGGRFFPFFAHYERKDADGRLAYKRTWVLWPFWQTLDNNLNSAGGEQHMWFLFPFYGRSDGPKTHQWTLMFPFLKYYENRGAGLGGPLWDLRAPFPFVHIMRGREREITDFWPFYGVKRRGTSYLTGTGAENFYRRFILWPIWHEEEQLNGDLQASRWWAMPFLWSFSSRNDVERWERREFKVWPLFRYKRWPDGRVALNILSPLWFQDPEGAFERIWGPLTRVYHEWRDEEGARRLDLLYGIYGERGYTSREGDEVAKTSLLFGLFQYERRGARRSLRFFWLPTGPDWGEGADRPREGYWDGGVGGERTPG